MRTRGSFPRSDYSFESVVYNAAKLLAFAVCAIIAFCASTATAISAPGCGGITSSDTGTFIGLTEQNGGFGNPNGIVPFLEANGLNNPTRVDKVEGLDGNTNCQDGESNVVSAINDDANDNTSGKWQSDVLICAVAVHAGGGQRVAVYRYDPQVTQGAWTTANNTNKQGNAQDISNLQFFTCDDDNNDDKGIIKLRKKTEKGPGVGNPAVGDNTFQLLLTRSDNTEIPVLITVNGFNTSAFTELTLDPGTYTFSEILPPDPQNIPDNFAWMQKNLECVVAADNDGGTVITNGTIIQLGADDVIECTAENKLIEQDTGQGEIIIKKIATGGNAPVTFDFTWINSNGEGLANPSQSVPTDGTVTEVFSQTGLRTGQYEISEDIIAGFNLTDVSCDDQNSPTPSIDSTGDSNTRTATINLDDGETVTCTFTNERVADPGKIIIKKTANGVTQPVTFDFIWDNDNGQGLVNDSALFNSSGTQTVLEELNLPAGNYVLREAVLDGWILQNIDCAEDVNSNSNGDTNTRQASIILDEGETVTCTFVNMKEGDDPMDDVTKKFIKRRVDNLLSHDPDRSRIIRRLDDQQQPSMKDHQPMKLTGNFANSDGNAFGSSKLSFSTSLSQMRAAAMASEAAKLKKSGHSAGELGFSRHPQLAPMALTPQRWDFWMEGHLSHYEDGAGGFNSDGEFGVIYAGVDYAINPYILVGMLVQFDWTDEDISGTNLSGNVEGNGWMAGPYVGLKLSDKLYFSARAAWGQSDNDIDITDANGHRTGSFDTDRWLATAELSGNWHFRSMRITPSIQVAYGNEDQEAYKNNLGQKVWGNDITIGRLKFGPEFAYRHEMDNGTVIEPHLSIEGVWNFDTDDVVLSNGDNIGDDDLRGKITGGVIVRIPNGMSMRLVGDYDGIGDEDFESYGGQLWINIPLN